MEWLTTDVGLMLLLLFGWFVVMRFIMPRFGVST
jgi:hypothetical protein